MLFSITHSESGQEFPSLGVERSPQSLPVLGTESFYFILSLAEQGAEAGAGNSSGYSAFWGSAADLGLGHMSLLDCQPMDCATFLLNMEYLSQDTLCLKAKVRPKRQFLAKISLPKDPTYVDTGADLEIWFTDAEQGEWDSPPFPSQAKQGGCSILHFVWEVLAPPTCVGEGHCTGT